MYHSKVWEKKDPSTTSKPKKAKKEEKNPVPVSEAPSSSAPSGQSAVPITPIIKTEISQNEPKIEPSNVPNIKIEHDLQPSPKIQTQARFGSIIFWTRIFRSKIFWDQNVFRISNQNKEFPK